MLVFRDITRTSTNGCAGGREAFHRLEQRSFVPRREDDGPTLPGEKLRDGVSEAAARPRNQGDVFGGSGRPRIRTLRHVQPRPSAIYLASRLQNLQTPDTARTDVALGDGPFMTRRGSPESMVLDVRAARNQLVEQLREAPKASAPADLQAYVGSPVPVLGLSVPTMRAILAAFAKDHRTLSAAEGNALADAL